jgi:hypothetical protein
MKRNIEILLTVFASFLLCGCSGFFDQVPEDRLSLEQIFQKQKYSEDFLATVYSKMVDESTVSFGIPFDACSDDLDISYDRDTYNTYKINLGNWSASSQFYDYWDGRYIGIRLATYFIQNIGNNQEMIANGRQDLIKQYTAEARFLRAYFCYFLLRQYGPIVLPTEELISGDLDADDPLMQLPRNTYAECVDYICRELDIAAKDLPVNFKSSVHDKGYTSNNYGRATAAACMAIKSRVLLLAASPQFNGNPAYSSVRNNDGTPRFSDYDKKRWELAADAAKDIIDLGVFDLYKVNNKNGILDPYMSCRDVFLDSWNCEAIMYQTTHDYTNNQRHGSPRKFGGYESAGVTQSLVDEFQMANGKGIRESGSGYSEDGFTDADYMDPVSGWVFTPKGCSKMYYGREPRFYVNVAFCGAYCLYNNQYDKYRWQLYYNGADGKKGSWDYPRTGYVRLKHVSPGYNFLQGKSVKLPHLVIRYAEILLNYVEALNEYDPGNPDILKYLNMVRERAGLPGVESGLNQEDMREKIHHERRVELCFEQLRYFDTRRWLKGYLNGGAFEGMNVDGGTSYDDPEFYQRTVFETRVFRDAYYLWPIPQKEINRDRNIIQNPGW